MIKTLALLLFSLSLSSCSRGPIPGKVVDIAPEFKPYVEDFIANGKNQNVSIVIDDLSIQFGAMHYSNSIGECYMHDRGTSGTPEIVINKAAWDSYSVTSREALLFHEMGHCVLWREHVSTWTGSIVTSIMYPYIQVDSMYLNNWNYYMNELFH
jgi:hypothetical protein